MENENKLKKIYKIFDKDLEDIFKQMEENILTANEEDREYIKETNFDIEIKTKELYKFLENNFNISYKCKQKVIDEIELFRDYIYDYMMYFVKKAFKIGFEYSSKIIIKSFNDNDK